MLKKYISTGNFYHQEAMSAAKSIPFNAGQSGNPNERVDSNTLEDSFLNVLGPSGYEQHPDKRAKFRHSRLHIPDRLPEKYLGPNAFMQERVDGLITVFFLNCMILVILFVIYFVFDEYVSNRIPHFHRSRQSSCHTCMSQPLTRK